MCHHIFSFPGDKVDNLNPDKTLTGVCKLCGTKQTAYGMRWAILKIDKFLHDVPYGESQFEGLQDGDI